MALVERLPHDPDAIDISALQRQKALEIWHRRRELPKSDDRSVWWKGWLGR